MQVMATEPTRQARIDTLRDLMRVTFPKITPDGEFIVGVRFDRPEYVTFPWRRLGHKLQALQGDASFFMAKMQDSYSEDVALLAREWAFYKGGADNDFATSAHLEEVEWLLEG